jgi:hypothetical protein
LAAAKTEDEEASQNRYLGKVANLSLQYRTYPKTFRKVARVQHNMPMELPRRSASTALQAASTREVPRYWDRQIQR